MDTQRQRFPLEQWFDLSRKIDRYDVDTAEAQMALYAVKDGLDPGASECLAQYQEMRRAVKQHNRKFSK